MGHVESFAGFSVEVIDSVSDYLEMMQEIFDFDLIRRLVSSPSFAMRFDSMHGVTGPYARAIFEDELGAREGSVINGVPKPDFGQGHPDPNLTYAHELVELMRTGKYSFLGASDGDGDRCMILGPNFFVNPSDSVAIIAANAEAAIPYFRKNPIRGVARSMPTSSALDRVAADRGWRCYETPTGWKFFGNLLDADAISICGEESFGVGSSHIREKDGLWCALAWLSIMAHTKKSIPNICAAHFARYGRNYFTRYDYEEVDSEKAEALMTRLISKFPMWLERKVASELRIVLADDFSYEDPIDHSVTKKQGVRFVFDEGSRVIFRLSGTGSSGATIRVYIEKYDATPDDREPAVALKGLVDIALKMCRLEHFTGRLAPTVIT
eukprot:Amastigsp_a339501_15.p2 type:complete len:381 gc:universal Amastigsp_a339501_15:1-1143(+)